MSYQIEKGVKHVQHGLKYPFREMDVGDSFFIPKGHMMGLDHLYVMAKKCGRKVSLRQTVVDGVVGRRVFVIARIEK